MPEDDVTHADTSVETTEQTGAGTQAEQSAPPQPHENEGFADFARRDLTDQAATIMRELEGEQTATKPEPARDAQAARPGTEAAAGDVFSGLDALVKTLPPAAGKALAEQVGTLRDWTGKANEQIRQVLDVARTVQAREAALAEREAKINSLLTLPQFRQALAAIAGQGNAGSPAPDDLPTPETDTERWALEQIKAGRQREEQLRGELAEIRQQVGQLRGHQQQTVRSGLAQELQEARAKLDKVYPTLAKDETAVQQWHDEAFNQWKAAGKQISLEAALERAARVILFDQLIAEAEERGKTLALEATKRVAQQTHLRPDNGAPAVEIDDGSLRSAFAVAKREHGLA